MTMKTEEEEKNETPITQPPSGIDSVVAVTDTADFEDGNNAAQQGAHINGIADAPWNKRVWEVITTFGPLSLVAFGGPQVCCGSC